jgi:hypothetical protein
MKRFLKPIVALSGHVNALQEPVSKAKQSIVPHATGLTL